MERKFLEQTASNKTESIKSSWSINVFALLWIAIVYTYALFKGLYIRLFVKNKKQPTKELSKYINIIANNKVSVIFSSMMFYWGLFIGKLLYHCAVILGWLWKHIIMPLGKGAIILLSALMVSSAISGKK